MAVDEALLCTAAELRHATLRLYSWSQPTLSLGYFQNLAQRTSHAASCNCPLVRRPSGGGAIVHDRELTYSFVHPVSSGVGAAAAIYNLFHQAFAEVLSTWGVPATLWQSSAAQDSPAPFLCFLRRNRGDVICAGAKVLGSAQRRHRGALLQHGSVLLARSSAAPELPGIEELVQVDIPPDELQDRWVRKLGQQLAMRFQAAELDEKENSLAQQLAADRFACSRWNSRR